MIENIADLALNVGSSTLVIFGIAWGLFKYWGKNWIKNQLAKDLEYAKAEIYLLSSRRMKLHDKEYEVFPELWARLVKTCDSVSASISLFKTMPDFSGMSDEDTRVIDYRNMNVRNIRVAAECFNEFREYLLYNRIFLSPEIKEKFDQILDSFRNSWMAKKIDLEHSRNTRETNSLRELHDTFDRELHDTFESEVNPLMREIELLVQNHLFPESKTGSGGEKEK